MRGLQREYWGSTDVSGDVRGKRYHKGAKEERVGREIGENGTTESKGTEESEGRNYTG